MCINSVLSVENKDTDLYPKSIQDLIVDIFGETCLSCEILMAMRGGYPPEEVIPAIVEGTKELAKRDEKIKNTVRHLEDWVKSRKTLQ